MNSAFSFSLFSPIAFSYHYIYPSTRPHLAAFSMTEEGKNGLVFIIFDVHAYILIVQSFQEKVVKVTDVDVPCRPSRVNGTANEVIQGESRRRTSLQSQFKNELE